MIVHDVDQRSPEWEQIRCGTPTASAFSRLITATGEPSKSAPGYAVTLACELFAGKPVDAWEGNAWTERGREMEEAAIALYEFARDASVVPVGFVTTDDGATGASPDGFVGEDGLVEVKCLKAENHVKAILYHRKHGKCPPDYVQQAQGQMMITGRAWCDVVFYHPELPLLVLRQQADAEIHKALREQIPLVCAERDRVLAVLNEQAPPGKEKETT